MKNVVIVIVGLTLVCGATLATALGQKDTAPTHGADDAAVEQVEQQDDSESVTAQTKEPIQLRRRVRQGRWSADDALGLNGRGCRQACGKGWAGNQQAPGRGNRNCQGQNCCDGCGKQTEVAGKAKGCNRVCQDKACPGPCGGQNCCGSCSNQTKGVAASGIGRNGGRFGKGPCGRGQDVGGGGWTNRGACRGGGCGARLALAGKAGN